MTQNIRSHRSQWGSHHFGLCLSTPSQSSWHVAGHLLTTWKSGEVREIDADGCNFAQVEHTCNIKHDCFMSTLYILYIRKSSTRVHFLRPRRAPWCSANAPSPSLPIPVHCASHGPPFWSGLLSDAPAQTSRASAIPGQEMHEPCHRRPCACQRAPSELGSRAGGTHPLA